MNEPIETAAALYGEMKNRGLHLRQESGRDNVLLTQLAKRLGCKDLNLQVFLDESDLSAQEFMTQFIDIAQPFALMFSEIWDYLSTYAAYESSESIAIRFGFPNSHDQRIITLEQFRRYLQRIRRIIVSVHLWSDDAIYSLYGLYKILLKNVDRGCNYNYEEGKPYTLPQVRSMGHPFDEIALRIQRLFQENIDSFVEKTQTEIEGLPVRSESEMENKSPSGFPTRRLTADLLPFWQIVFERYDQISDIIKTEALEYYKKQTVPLLQERKGQGVGMVIEALDVIDLPFWRHRWHTYEIWATVVTLRVLKEYNPIPRVVDGYIPIDGYGPATIADLEVKEYDRACVILQAQTPYIKGKRKAIKPDLRVCFSDILESEETAAIVEFKQQLKLSPKEIREVSSAYLNGSPKSGGVIVLNFDSIPASIKSTKRVSVIGDVHPCNQEAISKFESCLLLFLDKASLRPSRKKRVVLLDISGSMRGEYHDRDIQDSLRRLLMITKVSVFTFNNGLTSGRKLESSANTNIRTSGGTELGMALDDLEKLHGLPDRLLVVTDGGYICPKEKLARIPSVKECMPGNIQEYLKWLLGT